MKRSPDYFGLLHAWFGLSYSNYLVLPRSLMQGMPSGWQRRMVRLLDEARQVYDSDKILDRYTVMLRGVGGRFVDDPLANYRHPPPLPYQEAK